MKGSEKFKYFKSFLIFLSKLLALTPKFFRSLIYDLTKPYSGNLACAVRYALIYSQCSRIGDNVYIGANVTLKNLQSMSISNNVSIHDGCYIDAQGGITIEDDVSIAHASSLVSFEHSWEDIEAPIKYNPVITSPIHIKSDVWIGCGVRILSGVTINSRSVIAAGAVVTKDVPSNSLVAGVPAKFIKSLSNENT